jgi:hypothetical protein
LQGRQCALGVGDLLRESLGALAKPPKHAGHDIWAWSQSSRRLGQSLPRKPSQVLAQVLGSNDDNCPDGSGQPIVANKSETTVVAHPSTVEAPSQDVHAQLFVAAGVPPNTFAEQGLLVELATALLVTASLPVRGRCEEGRSC